MLSLKYLYSSKNRQKCVNEVTMERSDRNSFVIQLTNNTNFHFELSAFINSQSSSVEILGTLGNRNLIVSVVNFIAILNFPPILLPGSPLVPVRPWMFRDVKPG